MTGQTFEIPAEMRVLAEKSVEQARTAVASFISTAVKTTEQFQSSSKALQASLQTVVAKGLDQVQHNAAATFDHAQKLVRTRDAREALELHSAFVRDQIANLQAQAKDLSALAQKSLQPSA